MRTLTSSEIIQLWDDGLHYPRWRLGPLLLAPVLPSRTQRELLSLTLGELNEYLFALHRRLAGEDLSLITDCPVCSQKIEFGLSTSALVPDVQASPRPAATVITSGAWRVVVRPVCGRDLGSVADSASLDDAMEMLWRCAVISAEIEGLPVDIELLSEDTRRVIAGALPDIDPHSEIRLSLKCPECGCTWISLLDIASVVYEEIALEARRIMDEIHALASAYGWSEPQILGLHPRRRRYYLDMVS